MVALPTRSLIWQWRYSTVTTYIKHNRHETLKISSLFGYSQALGTPCSRTDCDRLNRAQVDFTVRPGYSYSCSRKAVWLLPAVHRQLIQWLEMSEFQCALVILPVKQSLWAEQLMPRILVNSVAMAAGRKTLHIYGGSRAEIRSTVQARVCTSRREEL